MLSSSPKSGHMECRLDLVKKHKVRVVSRFRGWFPGSTCLLFRKYTHVVKETLSAPRVPSKAHHSSESNEIRMERVRLPLGDKGSHRFKGLIGSFRINEAKAVANSVDVSINRKHFAAE